MATKTSDYTEGHARKNSSPSTQQTDFVLRAVKTYGNIESHAGGEEKSWEATNDEAEGCNQ